MANGRYRTAGACDLRERLEKHTAIGRRKHQRLPAAAPAGAVIKEGALRRCRPWVRADKHIREATQVALLGIACWDSNWKLLCCWMVLLLISGHKQDGRGDQLQANSAWLAKAMLKIGGDGGVYGFTLLVCVAARGAASRSLGE